MIIPILPVFLGLIIGAVVIFTPGATLISTLAAGAASLTSSLAGARKARQAEPLELPAIGFLRLKAA